MTPIYLNDWKDEGFFNLVADFAGICISKAEFETEPKPPAASITLDSDYWKQLKKRMAEELAKPEWTEIEILLASYEYANYSGDAFVLFRKEGKLFEVNAGHCSCYGLEDQWTPEETSIEALRHRILLGEMGSNYGRNTYKDELIQVLDSLEAIQ